jgi:hypothetical protein
VTGPVIVLVAILLAGLGGWLYGRHQIQAAWDRDEAAETALVEQLRKDNAAIQDKWNAAAGDRDVWKAKAEAAATDAARVADQLHRYRVRRCPLPEVPAAAAGTGSPATEPADIEGIERRHLANCAADAADFAAIRDLYNAMRAAQ